MLHVGGNDPSSVQQFLMSTINEANVKGLARVGHVNEVALEVMRRMFPSSWVKREIFLATGKHILGFLAASNWVQLVTRDVVILVHSQFLIVS